MGRPGPRQVSRHSLDFKLTVVQLSEQPGIQVQTVAPAAEARPVRRLRY
jgi:transposase-like protein